MSNIAEMAVVKKPSNGEGRYQYLTRTNRGTPAGELLRRYWQPVALCADFPSDNTPLPVRIMGEDLVLFRDDQGHIGALDRRCAHRCTDLALGRVEDGGIRCPYHGWLFDRHGHCLDQPAEASPTAKDRVHARSYPVHKAGGAFWVYLGPGEPPIFPDFPAITAPDEYRYTCRWFGDCNWMQASEGNIDPVHTSYLHRLEWEDPTMQARWGVFSNLARPKISIEDTRFGVRLYTERSVEDTGQVSLRITNFVMPNACAVGGFEGNLGPGGLTMIWDVPIDDEHHWRWEFIFHRSGKLDTASLDEQYRAEKVAGDRMRRSKEENYSQDRASMEREAYFGMGPCFSVHDVIITQSQGRIHEQAEEHLGSSDVAIVRARRLLDEAAREVEAGRDPRGVARDTAAADFRDVVVITSLLDAGASKEEHVAALAVDPMLYALEPPSAAIG